jgi:hypothetical protein
VTRNLRRKNRIKHQQAIAGVRYLEASRQIAAPTTGAENRVAVRPPLTDWLRPKQCLFWERLQSENGELIALRISSGHDWWDLDDRARAVAGALQSRPPHKRGLWLGMHRHTVTRRTYLAGIIGQLDQAGALDRLEVREVPDASACDHAACRRRRGLPVPSRSAREASSATAASAAVPAKPRAPMAGFEVILEREPSLNRTGFGVHHDQRVSAEQRARDLDTGRHELITHADTVRRVHDWLVVNVAAIKSPTTGSYGMKHVVEAALGEYVSNGELITAALMAGYPMRYAGGPNASFGMSRRDVQRLRRRYPAA